MRGSLWPPPSSLWETITLPSLVASLPAAYEVHARLLRIDAKASVQRRHLRLGKLIRRTRPSTAAAVQRDAHALRTPKHTGYSSMDGGVRSHGSPGTARRGSRRCSSHRVKVATVASPHHLHHTPARAASARHLHPPQATAALLERIERLELAAAKPMASSWAPAAGHAPPPPSPPLSAEARYARSLAMAQAGEQQPPGSGALKC